MKEEKKISIVGIIEFILISAATMFIINTV